MPMVPNGESFMWVDDPVASPVTSLSDFTLGPARQEGGYLIRGNYRIPMAFNQKTPGGTLEYNDNGTWRPVGAGALPGYDARQDSNVLDSNERRQFDTAFATAPEGTDLRTAREYALANGWQEPDRSNNEGTLGSALSNIIPGALALYGGVNALEALAASSLMSGGSAAASGGVGSINPALAESFAANYAPAAWAAPAGTAAGTAAAGSGAMDFSNLGDLWNFGDTAGGSTLSDLQAAADQFGWSDLASPGTTAGANADIGGTSWLSTLWEQAKANPLSTAGQVFKSVTGSSDNADWMKMLGNLGAAGLGAYASSEQTGALEDMAQRYEGYGAPYRHKLSDLYANPESFLQSNEVQKPVQQGTDMLMRSLSMQGNPFGSGNALQQGQSYASDQLFGKLGQEKDRLAGFGGLATYNAAAPSAATNAIGSSANTYNAIGSGLGNIFNPPKTESQTMADFIKALRG